MKLRKINESLAQSVAVFAEEKIDMSAIPILGALPPVWRKWVKKVDNDFGDNSDTQTVVLSISKGEFKGEYRKLEFDQKTISRLIVNAMNVAADGMGINGKLKDISYKGQGDNLVVTVVIHWS